MAEFDAGAGGLLGTKDLQSSIDEFNKAVNTLTSTVNNMATQMGNGMSRSPAMSQNAEGATFTSQPGMGAVQAAFMGLTPSQSRGAATVGAGGPQSAAGASGATPPTMNQTAAGGGANGGGATFGPPSGTALPGYRRTRSGYGVGGNEDYSSPAGPVMQNGGYYSGGGGMSTSGQSSPGMSFASTAVQAAGSFAGWAQSTGMSQLSNQLLFNAYGQQMQAQWGGSAQTYQNNTFGTNGYNGIVNNAAAGNAQAAAQEFGTLTQMAGGANVTSTAAFGATNALAFANQGLGAAGAAQVAASIYNPQRALMQQMLTGVGAINMQTGAQVPMAQQISGLASEGYLGGGGYNAKTGTFSQSALNASFTANRGTSYMNLQSLGYSPSQIQDIQSMMSEANQAATKGGTSFQNALNVMQQAEYGSGSQEASADAQLKKWGVNLSTIQKQGNLSSTNLSQQQSQSSTYNEAVSAFTSAMTKATNALNYFLDKTGLNKVVGGVQGAGAGYSSSGMSGWVNGAKDIFSGIASMAGMGGGAASVSTGSQPQTSGSRPGSSTSSVAPQIQTAVKDAEAQVGKPYVYGGDSPATSFDCSGLVQWAYGQAGVKLPRTSEQQWAFLQNKSVPPGQVREGDIVFQAGSDGTASEPGHEALMISSSQIVEAPYTGANIRIRAYNPGEWQHAGRPVGSGGPGSASTPVSGTKTGSAGSQLYAGNAGGSGDSALGLTQNADSMLFSGAVGTGSAPSGMTQNASNGSSSSSSSSTDVSTAGGGTDAQNEALAKKMAQEMYNWTGSQWSQGLLPLWTQESGFNNTAQNPTSTAYGIAQFLNSTWAAYGPKTSNPGLQIKYGLEYIKQRYGSPLAAEAHEKAYNWYSAGTPNADPGLAIVGERGPELVHLSGGQQIMNAQATSQILRGQSSAQAPFTASPAASLLMDTMTRANDYAQGGGVNISFGNITIQAGAGSGSSTQVTSSDTQTLGQVFEQAVVRAMQKVNLAQAIRQGDTG